MPDTRLSVLRPQYEKLFAQCRIRTPWVERVKATVATIEKHRDRYESVAQSVNPLMPWWFVGIIHSLEASFDWNAHLHNGDSLKRRTIQVPAGRPIHAPQNGDSYTWEESAVDALTLKDYNKSQQWDEVAILWRLEGFNGYGYQGKINSPYLWSGTNHYEKGKYVADGRYDSNAVSEQVGAAALMLLLAKEARPIPSASLSVPTGIRLEQVCAYYSSLPHQLEALRWLESQIPAETLASFASKWRQPQRAAVTLFAPKKDALAAKAVFEMRLRRTSELIEGQLTFYNSAGEQLLTCTATSGVAGYQTNAHFKTVRRGPCPPAKNLQLSLHGYHLETIGVEGFAYPILPNRITEYGRSEIMLHRDANVPGSSGCIVVRSTKTYEEKVCPLLDKTRKSGVDSIPMIVNYS